MVLALLALNHVGLSFDGIVDEVPDSINDVIDYFRDHGMKKIKLSLWNVADLGVRINNPSFYLHEIFWRESSQHVDVHRLLTSRRSQLSTATSIALNFSTDSHYCWLQRNKRFLIRLSLTSSLVQLALSYMMNKFCPDFSVTKNRISSVVHTEPDETIESFPMLPVHD